MFVFLFVIFLNIKEYKGFEEVAENVAQLPSSQYLLPLIMIESESQYYPPTHIEKDIKIKKYPSGLLGDTDFAKENYPGKPVFFCPAKPKYEKRMTYKIQQGSNLNKNCLFEKSFRRSKELKCSKIATPVLLKHDGVKCGPGGEGRVYEFAYELCIPMSEKEKQKLTMNTLFKSHKELPCREFTYFRLYKFCYIDGLNTTIYTEHEVISPTLFAYDEMEYDHEKVFGMITDGYEHFDSEFFKNQDKVYTTEAAGPKHKRKQIPQKLVPSEHLFFALWKQPTYHYTNIKPQNEQLSRFWKHITNLILSSTTSMIAHTHLIYTGAFKIIESERKMHTVGNQITIPDVWICLIIQFPKHDASSTPAKGVAFIMSNFIDRKDIEEKMVSYCEKSSCEKYLDKSFTKIGGYIRCCPATKEIQEFFGFELDIPKVLYLWELNYEEDIDFGKFDFDNPIP